MIDWKVLVKERNAWVAHNFPDPDNQRTPLDSVLGCIEEIGELTHHHLKQAQSIRGSSDFHEAEAKDAIGDCSVYLMGVMDYYDVYPSRGLAGIEDDYDPDEQILFLARWVGSMANNEIYWKEKNCAITVVDWLVLTMSRYCVSRGWEYEQIVTDTWNHVKERDWIKYPNTGLPPMSETTVV